MNVARQLPKAGLKTPLHREDWITGRLKFLFEKKTRPVQETDEVVTAFRDGVVTRRTNRRKDGFTFAEKEIGYQGIEPCDLAIHAMDGFAGAIGVSDSRGKVSPVLSVLVPQSCAPAEPQFWAYYLRHLAVTGFIESLAKGIRERSTDFRWKDASNLLVNYPDLPTQKAIADFLDRETARIDQLIEKKQRMVEVLGEKRQAVISRAVTKGLDADVPMKDSGVVWLGDIPVHWDVKQLRRAIMFQRGHDLPTDEREEGEVVIVSSSGVSSTHSRAIAKAPGIVTGRYGTIGQFHLINQDYWPLNTTLYSINLYGNEPRFLLYMLAHMSPQFLAHAVKSAVPGVDRKDVHADHVAVPPISEQRAIAAFLDRETVRIDTLVTKIRETIDRLREFRSALITAAVTGQIDVSTWSNQGTSDRRLDQIEEATSA